MRIKLTELRVKDLDMSCTQDILAMVSDDNLLTLNNILEKIDDQNSHVFAMMTDS